jgi:hypothetical protein
MSEVTTGAMLVEITTVVRDPDVVLIYEITAASISLDVLLRVIHLAFHKSNSKSC